MRFSEKIDHLFVSLASTVDAEVNAAKQVTGTASFFVVVTILHRQRRPTINRDALRHNLPLTMYRQIEKMSIHSLTKQQAVHKYNVNLVVSRIDVHIRKSPPRRSHPVSFVQAARGRQ
jgi:hypothetical protein